MNREILAFNYREARSLVVCRDIHGAFEEMVFKLCVQYGMTDTLLIVAGDFRAGHSAGNLPRHRHLSPPKAQGETKPFLICNRKNRIFAKQGLKRQLK